MSQSPMKQTRKERARELLDRVRRGPADLDAKTRRAYRLWSTTWILPEMQRLIPELRDTAIEQITCNPIEEPKA